MSGVRNRQELADRLGFVIGTVNRRLRPPSDALTHVSTSALASIARAGAIRSGDLARVEGIAAPGMTRLVAELKQNGLVAREADPADGRSYLLRLTAEGDAALLSARRARAASVERLLESCTEDDLTALRQAVTALEGALLRTTVQDMRTGSDLPV